MKITFVTSDGVKQVADVYQIDIIEAREALPGRLERQVFYTGWAALNRQGDEVRPFDEWLLTLKVAPDVELEEGDENPKDSGGEQPPESSPLPELTGEAS